MRTRYQSRLSSLTHTSLLSAPPGAIYNEPNRGCIAQACCHTVGYVMRMYLASQRNHDPTSHCTSYSPTSDIRRRCGHAGASERDGVQAPQHAADSNDTRAATRSGPEPRRLPVLPHTPMLNVCCWCCSGWLSHDPLLPWFCFVTQLDARHIPLYKPTEAGGRWDTPVPVPELRRAHTAAAGTCTWHNSRGDHWQLDRLGCRDIHCLGLSPG